MAEPGRLSGWASARLGGKQRFESTRKRVAMQEAQEVDATSAFSRLYEKIFVLPIAS
jgi:hypothetical protein